MTKKEFWNYVKKNSPNCLNDNGLAETIKELLEQFDITILCKKCGSSKIAITGEDGVDYGDYTGYSSGSNVFKCETCGNAIVLWK